MSTTTPVAPAARPEPEPPQAPAGARTAPPRDTANTLFAGLSLGAGIVILITLLLVAIFLLLQAWPALTAGTEAISGMTGGRSFAAYVAPLLFGTVLASVIALLLAVPLAIGISLFISHYAPRKVASVLGYLVDLLAAIPSVVYGLWGFVTFRPVVEPAFAWLNENLGFIPLFDQYQAPARNILFAGMVLAIMVLPIITATIRETFLQTPRLHEEAAWALGATRWEMVRMAVLPFGRSGMIAGSMLGLGRALGETMAILMVLSPGLQINFHLLQPGQHQTIAGNIALNFPEAFGINSNVLIATGLALFVLTFLVNYAARFINNRRSEFSGAN